MSHLTPSFEQTPTHDERVNVRLTGPQLDALDAYADRQGLTRAQAVRQSIACALLHEFDAVPTA